MPFTKGESGNEYGRPKGATNKITRELREMISNFLMENFDKVKQDFEELPPKERAKVYCDLLQYGLPKLQSMALGVESVEGRQVFNVTFNLDDDKKILSDSTQGTICVND